MCIALRRRDDQGGSWISDTVPTSSSASNAASATIPVQARQQEYDRYTVFEYERHGNTIVDLVVGEEFSGVQDRRSARLVPIVTVHSPKPVVTRAVAAAVLPR